MSAARSRGATSVQGQRGPRAAITVPGPSPRLMSPTDVSVIGRMVTRAAGLRSAPARARRRQLRVFGDVGSFADAAPFASAFTALMPYQTPLLERRSIAIGWPGPAPMTVTG